MNVSTAISLHPHGVFYNKASEGAYYVDGTTGADKNDDHVYAGQTVVYTWEVPTRAGPGPNDPSSLVWLYHGHFFEPSNVNLGCIGAIVITGAGMARDSTSYDGLMPSDVDREFILFPNVFDESESDFFFSYTLLGYDLNLIYEQPDIVAPYR